MNRSKLFRMQQRELQFGGYKRRMDGKMRRFNRCLIGLPEGKNGDSGGELSSITVSPKGDK